MNMVLFHKKSPKNMVFSEIFSIFALSKAAYFADDFCVGKLSGFM